MGDPLHVSFQNDIGRLGATNLSGHNFFPGSQGFRFFTFVGNHPGEDLARLCYWTGRSQDSKCPFLNSVAVWRPPGAGALNLANPVQKPCFFRVKISKTILCRS
jgi:hypothetical protein